MTWTDFPPAVKAYVLDVLEEMRRQNRGMHDIDGRAISSAQAADRLVIVEAAIARLEEP